MAFRVPTRLTIEPGCCAARLGGEAALLARGAVALISDDGLAATPWPEVAHESLRQAGLTVCRLGGVEANPRATTIEQLAEKIRQNQCTAVVGLGGGSVLDATKAAAMLATNGGRCADYIGRDRYSRPPLPFLAVPTTCGTGSEVTWVSVISDEATRRKISVKGESMFPDRALVDADLLASLPPSMVAATGVDALTHALEAYTGKAANPASDALALRAVETLFRYLPRAVADIAGDSEARAAVMEASTLAGLAFGNADVGPVHCLSEALGGLFDVPHGLTNAVLLAPVLRSHGASIERQLSSLAPRILGRPAPTAARGEVLSAIEELVKEVGLPTFSALEIPPTAFEEVAAAAEANGSNPSSPRPMAAGDYLAILTAVGR